MADRDHIDLLRIQIEEERSSMLHEINRRRGEVANDRKEAEEVSANLAKDLANVASERANLAKEREELKVRFYFGYCCVLVYILNITVYL